jgi:hypothetical protein
MNHMTSQFINQLSLLDFHSPSQSMGPFADYARGTIYTGESKRTLQSPVCS